MDNDGIERLETIMKPTKKHRGVLLFIYFLTVSLQAVVGMQLYRLAESYNVRALVFHFTRRRHSVRSIPGRSVVQRAWFLISSPLHDCDDDATGLLVFECHRRVPRPRTC